MLGKIVIIIFFVVILYNLFTGLMYLINPKSDHDPNGRGLLTRLKWRIVASMLLFFLILMGFFTGFIQLHTL